MNNIFLLNDFISNGFRIEFVDFIYIFSILFGVFTIISRNPIVSVLFLIGLFVNVAGLLILMLINIRISELLNETNNDIPLAILTVLLFYYIIGQVLPSNLTDNTIITNLSNPFFESNNVSLDNEYFNIVDLKQQIAFASSKA